MRDYRNCRDAADERPDREKVTPTSKNVVNDQQTLCVFASVLFGSGGVSFLFLGNFVHLAGQISSSSSNDERSAPR